MVVTPTMHVFRTLIGSEVTSATKYLYLYTVQLPILIKIVNSNMGVTATVISELDEDKFLHHSEPKVLNMDWYESMTEGWAEIKIMFMYTSLRTVVYKTKTFLVD